MRFAILAIGIGAWVLSTQALAQPTEPTGTQPAAATATQITPPPDGKGQVVFFRPSRLKAMVISYSIREGDTTLGKLGNGTYFVLPAEPGLHTYMIQSELKDSLRLEVEPGETYYVMQSMDIGIALARAYLTPSDAAAFAREKVKPSKPVE